MTFLAGLLIGILVGIILTVALFDLVEGNG